MPDYVEGSDDFRIKYSGCYVRLKELPPEAEPHTAHVAKIDDQFDVNSNGDLNRAHLTLFYRNKENATRTKTVWVQKKYIDWQPLRTGIFNMAKSCLMVQSRVPEGNAKYRQFPHPHSIQLFDPFQEERKFLGARQPTKIEEFFVLDGWGDLQYFNAVDAMEKVLAHDRLGAAFSKHWSFGISYAGDGVFLYRDGMRVARVNTQKEIILKPPVHCLAELLTEYGLNVKKVEK